MKKLLFFFFLIVLFFSSCSYNEQLYSVALSIVPDDSTVFVEVPTGMNYFTTSVGTIIKAKYMLIPDSDQNIDVTEIISLDDLIISIESIDFAHNTFTAKAQKPGNTKLRVKTKSFSSSTSLIIYVN